MIGAFFQGVGVQLVKHGLYTCPICGARTSHGVEPVGPFCSERCRLIDLGNWLGERYIIPLEEKAKDNRDDEVREGETRFKGG